MVQQSTSGLLMCNVLAMVPVLDSVLKRNCMRLYMFHNITYSGAKGQEGNNLFLQQAFWPLNTPKINLRISKKEIHIIFQANLFHVRLKKKREK